MMNSRTTRSSPSRRHRSSAADAALTAVGAVISGSETTIIDQVQRERR